MLQVLADADALVFLEKNFSDMFNRMPAEEVGAAHRVRRASASEHERRGVLS